LTLWHPKFPRFHGIVCCVRRERRGVGCCLESFVDIYYNFSRLLLNLKSYFYYLLLLLLLMLLLVGEFAWCGCMDNCRRDNSLMNELKKLVSNTLIFSISPSIGSISTISCLSWLEVYKGSWTEICKSYIIENV